MNWTALQKKSVKWSRETFKDSTMESNLAHLRDEIDEIEQNPDDIEEWADVILLYMNGASLAGHTMDDILEAAYKKYEKNINRKWGIPDDRGVVKHSDE